VGNNSCDDVAGEKMTLNELISAMERLQAVYTELRDEQERSKEKIRWAINHLADKIWTESL
jgi:hypothetical protein